MFSYKFQCLLLNVKVKILQKTLIFPFFFGCLQSCVKGVFSLEYSNGETQGPTSSWTCSREDRSSLPQSVSMGLMFHQLGFSFTACESEMNKMLGLSPWSLQRQKHVQPIFAKCQQLGFLLWNTWSCLGSYSLPQCCSSVLCSARPANECLFCFWLAIKNHDGYRNITSSLDLNGIAI